MKTNSCLGFTVALVALSGLFSSAISLPASDGTEPSPIDARFSTPCNPGIAQNVALVTVERFEQGFWSTPCVFMARSPAEWNLIMQQMQDNGELVLLPPPPAPNVDWKRQIVIVASLGQLNTNGYSISVQSVKRVHATAVLDLQINLPDSDLLTPTITSPYHMVAIDRAGMKNVSVCRRNYVYGSGSTARGQPALDFETIPGAPDDEPPATGETWGSLKARYRQ